MPKRNETGNTTRDIKQTKRFRNSRYDMRIGRFYREFNQKQRRRFDTIVKSLAKRCGVIASEHPMEMIIIREIALDTVKIDSIERAIVMRDKDRDAELRGTEEEEKWLMQAKKNRREAIRALSTVANAGKRVKGVVQAGDLRNQLRQEQGLKREEIKIKQDGHQRRHYDNVTRTKKI